MKLLIVVDMQNDFIDGSVGTSEAKAIVPKVKTKIDEYRTNGDDILFTLDTHYDDYLETQEGKYLPVKHCIDGTQGWNLSSELDTRGLKFKKNTFGSIELANSIKENSYDEIEMVGLCTDICVVSNALILKAALPEMRITVDASCCAGVTPESHNAALITMKMCQINIINE